MLFIRLWCVICLVLLLSGGCEMSDKILKDPRATKNDNLLRLAFGSCNNQKKSQAYWKNIADYFGAEHGPGYPDVWIWAGDIVYADTDKLKELKDSYEHVKGSDGYSTFVEGCKRADCQIVGVWDDHDFGGDNLVGYYPGSNPPPGSPFEKLTKPERKEALVDFLGEPTRSKVAEREQVYASYDFKHDGDNIRLILLDLRYDRQKGGKDAKIMGQAQWDWLQETLMDKDVDLHLIVSSTQVLRKDIEKDTWGEYEKQRDKLLKLIGDSPAKGIVLLTGDIHAAEVSRLGDAEEAYYDIDFPLYEITSSSLNRRRCFLSFCWYPWRNAYQEGFVKK